MRRFRTIALIAAAVILAAPGRADSPLPSPLQVLGTVTNAARPVADALVIALNLQDLKATQTWTTNDGRFVLPALRSGVYKIIAVKQGFNPAITTVLPTGAEHRVSLRLDSESESKRKSVNQEIWELRGLLTPDVLRSLDFALRPLELASYDVPRIRGEMVSLTGVTNEPANPAYAHTTLGVQGRIGETWQVGIKGNLQRFEDPTDEIRFGPAVAETSSMSMELSSSPTNSYRVASTRSSWAYADREEGEGHADVRAHNFKWQHGPGHLEVRYFEQENLFRDLPLESQTFEIAGNMPLIQTRRNDFGVSLRMTQESIESSDALRTATLAANGSFVMVPALIVHYGMASRIGIGGQEWAPRTGAEWKMTKNTSLVGSVLYKVIDRDQAAIVLPAIVFWSEDTRVIPRYAYSFGFISGRESGPSRFSAIATITAVDDPLRVVFADAQNQFWDGLAVDAGDVRRDLRVAYRREFGNRFAVDVATTAGTAASGDRLATEREKVYLTGDLQSTYSPTGTTLAVSYHDVQQPRDRREDDYRTERLHVRMAQSLYLPIDVKLLIGLELVRSENSPYLIDTLTPESRTKKYIGGLAVNF